MDTTVKNHLDGIRDYIRTIWDDESLSEEETDSLVYLDKHLPELLAGVRRLTWKHRRGSFDHPTVAALIKYFAEHPFDGIIRAGELNEQARIALGRFRPFGTSHLKSALETLGYQPLVVAEGTLWHRPQMRPSTS